ncbi:hypothetical protein QO004_004781 [Rhizobium mesoamericanum]|uniref:hypothetical protein n=1 Tax=Rhizobium mesoamericanum TaxID=1079800 RepID=UPI0027887871|nr:hypothetical protein [Rhizobium mesoamericanum]MDQ0562972.1 hypothetical protein [Rhizobium mesoamericanum]
MSEDMEAGEAGWLGDEIISSGLPDKRLARQSTGYRARRAGWPFRCDRQALRRQ